MCTNLHLILLALVQLLLLLDWSCYSNASLQYFDYHQHPIQHSPSAITHSPATLDRSFIGPPSYLYLYSKQCGRARTNINLQSQHRRIPAWRVRARNARKPNVMTAALTLAANLPVPEISIQPRTHRQWPNSRASMDRLPSWAPLPVDPRMNRVAVVCRMFRAIPDHVLEAQLVPEAWFAPPAQFARSWETRPGDPSHSN